MASIVSASETSTGGSTVKLALPFNPPNAAWIVVDPTFTAVTSPVPLIVAMLGSAEVQAVSDETSRVPSLNVAAAVNCCAKPAGLFDFDVVTAMAVGGKTVAVALPLTALNDA